MHLENSVNVKHLKIYNTDWTPEETMPFLNLSIISNNKYF